MYVAYIVFGIYRDASAVDYVAGVDVMFQEECSHARFGVAVYHRPVQRSGASVFRKQRSVEVERAEPGHAPHHFGKHSESDYDKQVGIEAAQLVDKFGILQVGGLHEVHSVFHGILLDRRLQQLVAASGRLVGHRHYACNVVSTLVKALEALDRKFRRSEKHYLQFFLVHVDKIFTKVMIFVRFG